MVTELVWKIVLGSIIISLCAKFIFNFEIDGLLVFSGSVVGLFVLFVIVSLLEEIILKKKDKSNKNSDNES